MEAELPESVSVPILAPSSKKATVPVGVPDPGNAAFILAVIPTCCPGSDGLLDDEIIVDTLAWLTVWVRMPVLWNELASPEYTAVTTCNPSWRDEVPQLALPPDMATAGPMFEPSTWNWTEPVACGLT